MNFDLGGDLPAFVQYAAGQDRQPAPRQERAEDTPVWVSFSNEDIKGLGDAFYFKDQDAVFKNRNASVFLAKTSELGLLNGLMHAKYHKCAGFFTHSTPDSAKDDLQPPPVSASLAYTIDKKDQVEAMLKLAEEKGLTGTINSLSAFKNRYYTSVTGVDSSKWLQNRWKELAGGREDISVAAFKHSNWAQESVILTVQGASEPQKIIVLGGHMDSIARGGDNSVAPGADDNASGIAALTEAIRVLAASGYRPAKTLKFMAYAAEEVGLRGSQDIAATFKREGRQVDGVIQFDMTNYNGSAEDVFLITDHTNASQNAFLANLVRTYTDYKLGETRCGYACSDHASWTKNGFPASFPFEAKFSEDNPNIHSAKDTIAQSGGHSKHALKFAKLAIAYLVEMAK
ncbi:MAG: M20/M25/M40 family metallo-hydrolase [Elusimicrobia bacterium]|nr:M20/M25/M40 family metallo-hydrolase [Elusimicrobiota bacterium]